EICSGRGDREPECCGNLRRPDRHRDRGGVAVLRRGELSSGVLPPQPRAALLCLCSQAQGREIPEALPGKTEEIAAFPKACGPVRSAWPRTGRSPFVPAQSALFMGAAKLPRGFGAGPAPGATATDCALGACSVTGAAASPRLSRPVPSPAFLDRAF